MRSLRIFAIVLLLGGSAAIARADDTPSPEALAAATELFAILSGDMMKQMTAQVTKAFWPTVEQKARAEKIDEATIADMRAEFERIQLAFLADAMKEAPPIYARHFSVAELHELTAFYRTPTGAKGLREMPLVMGEFSTLLMPRLQEVQHETAQAFGKILRQHGYMK